MAKSLTLSEAIDRFLLYLEESGSKENSIKGRASDLNVFAKFLEKDLKVTDIKQKDLSDFLSAEIVDQKRGAKTKFAKDEDDSDKPSKETLYRRQSTILKFFAWLTQSKFVERDIAYELPRIKNDRNEIKKTQNLQNHLLSSEEVKKIIDNASDSMSKMFFSFLAHSGINSSSATGLTVQDIDFKKKTINVNDEKYLLVPILEKELEAYIKRNRITHFLFPSRKFITKHAAYRNLEDEFSKIVSELQTIHNDGERVSMRDLREYAIAGILKVVGIERTVQLFDFADLNSIRKYIEFEPREVVFMKAYKQLL